MHIVIGRNTAVVDVKRNGVEVEVGLEGLEITLEDDGGFVFSMVFDNENTARRLAREILAAYGGE